MDYKIASSSFVGAFSNCQSLRKSGTAPRFSVPDRGHLGEFIYIDALGYSLSGGKICELKRGRTHDYFGAYRERERERARERRGIDEVVVPSAHRCRTNQRPRKKQRDRRKQNNWQKNKWRIFFWIKRHRQ